MRRKPCVTCADTSKNLTYPRRTRRQIKRTLPLLADLDAIGLQELNRLVGERERQADGLLPGDARVLTCAAWIFSKQVRLRHWFAGKPGRRVTDIYLVPLQRQYVGLCHAMNCAPALPSRQEDLP